jgi:hypothetical protein
MTPSMTAEKKSTRRSETAKTPVMAKAMVAAIAMTKLMFSADVVAIPFVNHDDIKLR